MLELTDDPAFAREVVLHAWATKYLTIAGFTLLVWDHACTFEDEVRFMWPAPKSLVKTLFLGNRYMTPIFQAVTLYQMTRVAGFSDTFCKIWNLINGFAEIVSMASLDLLLLFRLHAIWGGERRIVIGTYALYCFAYSCLVGTGVKSAVDLTPHIHYSKLAKMCTSDDRPALMSALWAFALFSESVVFAMTLMKALQHRRTHEAQTPLLKGLYRDQFLYYTIIIFLRTFNLCIWNVLPPTLLFLGVSFIWALVTALVSRIMLNLRGVACSNTQTDQTFFADSAYSTRIVWARRPDTFESSLRTITPEDGRAAGPPVDAGAITSQSTEAGGDEGIELQDFRSRTHEVV